MTELTVTGVFQVYRSSVVCLVRVLGLFALVHRLALEIYAFQFRGF